MAAARSGKRRKAEEKVDITQLSFGEDFEGQEALANAEVKAIIDALNKTNGLEFEDLDDMMQNTSKYVDTFGLFQDTTSIRLCKDELVNMGLQVFEAASMANLQPATADEAKRLIASLSRFMDDHIADCCAVVQRYKKT